MNLFRKAVSVFLMLPLLGGHAQTAGLPDTSPLASLGAGSKVVVKAQVILPANQDVVYFQNGVFTTWQNIDSSSPSCRLYVGDRPVARQLVPGREMVVTGTRFNNASDSTGFYGDTLVFGSDATVGQMQCRSGHHGYMTIGELKICFGDLFSLVEAAPVVG